MICEYPKFTKLNISHKKDIKKITAKFEPYSDFNFTSLFAWNTTDTTTISDLNGNLVVHMPDYITGKAIYSILGNSLIDESLIELLKITDKLSMVPKITVESIVNKDKFKITPQRDHHDYIYKVTDQAKLPGRKYRGKRKRINKFLRANLDSLHLRKASLSNPDDRKIIYKIFEEWVIERNRTIEEAKSEGAALDRLLKNYSHFDLMYVLIFLDGQCVGYSINEILNDEFAICHFQKAKLKFEYIDIFLSSLVAKELQHRGIEFINWEQDLGIPGLRELKQSYLHDHFLKKYSVELK